MTSHTELLFTWSCDQCHQTGTDARLTRKEAATDGQTHFSMHLSEALERAKQEGYTDRQCVGLVRVIPVPVATNTEVL